ncbi:hypothetical protein [Burkholderia stagnalis]|uniref:hypothetical protein n=1 Tax=Burkholderia stagnalis TaxID=1503054 RepID=UPI0012D9DA0E|nr:hypothetical protein [Burkholderia stagnalis]
MTSDWNVIHAIGMVALRRRLRNDVFHQRHIMAAAINGIEADIIDCDADLIAHFPPEKEI